MPFFAVHYDDGSSQVVYGAKPFSAPKPVGLEPRVIAELATSSEVFIPYDATVAIVNSFTGRELIMSVTLGGWPVPVVTLTDATVDAADVSGDVTITGEGPTFAAMYVFPDSAADITYSFTVQAVNNGATVADTFSGTLAGNLPLALASLTLTGGAGELTLDFTDAAGNATRTVTSYEYEATDSADTGFAAVSYSGSVESDINVTLTSVPAGDYIARARAVNADGPGAWIEATAATVT